MPSKSLAELANTLCALWNDLKPPPISTYVSLLKSCTALAHGGLPFVKELQAHATHHRIPLSGTLGNHFVLALAKCGSLDDALLVSQQLPYLSVLSGTALICAYTDSGRPYEALSFFQWMQECRIAPSSYTIVALLKACGIIQDLHEGMLFHANAIAYGFLPNDIINNTLASMYGKSGALLDAEYMFHMLSERNLVSWNAMLSAYVELGDAEKALWLYGQMQEANVKSDRPTFVTLLRACSVLAQDPESDSENGETLKHMALEIGCTLHADICSNGFAHNVYVSCSLITMYGKCGSLSEAENVFAALPHHDVVSCGALLSVYVGQGLGEMALLLYRQILKEGLVPDKRADCLALQACKIISQNEDFVLWKEQELALQLGQALDSKAFKEGQLDDTSVNTYLVNLYGSCGAIAEAFGAFSVLPQQDVTVWNSLLYANVTCGHGIMALHIFIRMQKDGVIPTKQTYLFALQACALYAESDEASVVEGNSIKIKALKIGQALHNDAEMRCFTSDLFICNNILNVYIKSKALFEAEVLFTKLVQKNVVSWSLMISGYVDELQAVTALNLYQQMQIEAACLTERTFVLALQACICLANDRSSHVSMMQSNKTASFEIGRALHADFRRRDFPTGAVMMCTIAYMYCECGTLIEAESMFDLVMACQNPPWNVVLSIYVQHNKAEKALLWYMKMQTEGKEADGISLACAVRACIVLSEKHGACGFHGFPTRVVALEIGRALHADARREGIMSDPYVSSAIVSMYGKCGLLCELEEVVEGLSKKSIALWNAVLSAYLAHSLGEEIIELYRQILKHIAIIDEITLINALQGSSIVGDVTLCMEVHFSAVCAGFDQSLSFVPCIIYVYGSCASMIDALGSFNTVIEANIIAWNACIAGHAREGHGIASLSLLEEVKFVFGKPCAISFITILSSCGHVGLLVQGLSYFISMCEDYDYIPEAKHYGSVLDILGRGGDFRRLENLLGKMPVESNIPIRLLLLGACRTHSNAELALDIFHDAEHFDAGESTAYVLLSNVFAHEVYGSKANVQP